MKTSFKITEYEPALNGLCKICGLKKEFHKFNMCPVVPPEKEEEWDGKSSSDVLPYVPCYDDWP